MSVGGTQLFGLVSSNCCSELRVASAVVDEATDLDELEPQCFYAAKETVQCGSVVDGPFEHRVNGSGRGVELELLELRRHGRRQASS